MEKTLLILYAVILCTRVASAQDPAFSQFYIQRMYLNPALIGGDRGLAFTVGHRNQWRNINQGFQSKIISAEIRNDCALKSGAIGLGLLVSQTEEGLARYQRSDIGFGFNFMFGQENIGSQFGVTTRWRQESINTDNLIFSDQLDPVRPNPEPSKFTLPYLDHRNSMDVDAGAAFRINSKEFFPKGARIYPKLLLGFSMHNLVSFWKGNENSFLDKGTSGISPRLNFHANISFPVEKLDNDKNTISTIITLRTESQGKNPIAFKKSLMQTNFGCYFLFNNFYLGGMYQHRNIIPINDTHTRSWVLAVGFYIPKSTTGGNEIQRLMLGLSWDLNSTDKALGTSTGNAFEVGLRWRILNKGCWGLGEKNGRDVRNKIPDCETLMSNTK